MKKLLAIALLFAAGCIATYSAPAQGLQARAKVSFTFTAGDTRLPAGTYQVTMPPSSSFIHIDNWKTGVHVVARGQPGRTISQSSSLLFHKHGGEYFLSEIRYADASTVVHLATTVAERQAIARTEAADVSGDSFVLVGLN